MAKLNICGKSIEMETDSYEINRYYAEITIETEETVDTDRIKSAEIALEGDSRRDITFDQVEQQINEYFEENHSDMEIVDIKSVEVIETQKIKKRPFGNYSY